MVNNVSSELSPDSSLTVLILMIFYEPMFHYAQIQFHADLALAYYT